MKSIDGIAEADCPRCGKHFVVQPLLVYKRGDKRFCSYHCYDHYLTEIESQKKKRGRKARDERN
jgi:hypothetical protein